VSVAVQVDPEIRRGAASAAGARIVTDGKFLRAGGERFLVKGVTYGTFAPDAEGYQFPPMGQIAEDFRLMAGLGVNTVRVYTPPRRDLLDEAARHGLRVMVGLPWSQHVAFLDDRSLRQGIRRELLGRVRELGAHPAVLMFVLGNEIPPGVVPSQPVRRGESGVTRKPVHLRQLPAD
jgi:beta-galactosidase/beta-glucuronidase